MAGMKEEFESPGAAYRGKPFWAWNGKLEEDELRRQVRVMHRMGLGGFFMHSRVGLATEYLCDEWFRMIGACVDEARKLAMEAWLYDEDRWPSGAAGGIVTADPACQHKSLQMVIGEPDEVPPEPPPLALFSARLEGNAATDVRRLPEDWDGALDPPDQKVLAFYVKADRPSSWYNGATYLDTMSHEAVRRFIEVTYEAYKDRFGEEFGRVVPGVFTDEPNHGGIFGGMPWEGQSAFDVPWTPALPEHFQERYGYEILDHLPELFLRVDGRELSQARWHYYDCTTFLFVDAFARQIGEWCGENGLLFTGHCLAEESLCSQSSVGGSPMRFYEHMQAPGIDVLTQFSDEYTTAKQCSSVLRQTGRRWMLSELYGCTGWDFTFEGHKAVGDWQAALGVNLRCQHLSWYTMAGAAKRDYPASIHFQSPWWQRYGKVEDYFARVGAVMSRGRPVRRLLVVHPVESVWARLTVGYREDEAVGRLERAFAELIEWLLDGHVDFDYGEEEMLSRLASVTGSTLRVGQADYAAVLVPPADTLRGSTLALLREFREAGGPVVFCEPAPTHLDALPSEEPAALAGRCERAPFEREAVVAAVAPARVVSIRDEAGAEKAGVLYLLHAEGVEQRLFLCNTDRELPSGPLRVALRGAGHVQLWDAETGERYAVQSEREDGQVRFETSMPPSGSRLFVVTPDAADLPAPPAPEEVRSVEPPAEEWSAELTEPNVLVLDMPEFRVGDEDWEGPTEILRADAQMRDAVGLPRRGGQMVQPWARHKAQEGPSAPFDLSYRFTVDQLPVGPLFLAVEQPERLQVRLNGHLLPPESDSGWWVDPAIRLLPVDEAALVAGENELLVSGTMDSGCDLEIAYLLGGFAVAVDGAEARVTGALEAPSLGDWAAQGMPFYAGSVVYRARVAARVAEGERAFVQVPGFAGVGARVLIDGEEAGVIGWPPHEVEVTDLLAGKAEATVAVEVLGHRRNAFGPLHLSDPQPRFVGPGEFVSGGERWQDHYSLVPAGCLAPPRLSMRR